MSFFDGTDDAFYNTAPPLVGSGYPFSCGMWINLSTLVSGLVFPFIFADTATSTHRLCVRVEATEQLSIVARDTGTAVVGTMTTALAVGTWNYVVARFISATNRRMAALYSDGSVEHIQSTTSKVPAGLDTVTIGANKDLGGISNYWPGGIAEVWYTDTDIQADGGQLSETLLRQLAYYGPFSVPAIGQSVLEYHSLKSSLPHANSAPDEHYYKAIRQTWTANGGPTLGPHPPLPYAKVQPAFGMM